MQVPTFIQGCIAPTFTAFDQSGALDPDGQRNLLDYMLQSGCISAFFLRSGMGQMYHFSCDDVKALARNACGHLAGKAPCIIGCNGAWDRDFDRRPAPDQFERECVELGHYAADQGADGIVYTVPEALAPRDGETYADRILRFFEHMVREARVPVFIYQPPGTHPDYELTPGLARSLAAMDGLCGVKVSYGDVPYVLGLIRAVKDEAFAFITGNETIYFATLYAGSRAVIGQGASVSPSVLDTVRQAFLADNRERALQAQEATNELVFRRIDSPWFLKRYATEQGFPVGPWARGNNGVSPYAVACDATDAAYEDYKRLFEEKLAQFPPPS